MSQTFSYELTFDDDERDHKRHHVKHGDERYHLW